MRLTEIAPVAVEPVGVDLASLDESRQQQVAEVAQSGVADPVVALVGLVGLLAVQLLEHLEEDVGLVEEDLGRHGGGGGPVRLVGERGHPAQPVGLDDAVVSRVLAVHTLEVGDHDGDLRVLGAMGVHDVPVVEPVDVVRAHHQHEFGIRPAEVVAQPEELVGVAVGEALLIHRAGALLRDQEAQPATRAVEVPRPAVAHLVLEGRGLVLHREPDVVDPRVDEVRQREVEQLVAPAERQCRLRPLQGEHVHPPTSTAGLDDREDLRGLHCPATYPTGGGPTTSDGRFLALRGAVLPGGESRVRLLGRGLGGRGPSTRPQSLAQLPA